jgi:hypothetical protein
MSGSKLLRWSIGSTLIVGCVVLVLAVTLTRGVSVTANSSQATIVTLLPPGDAHAGELITVKLVVNNARNLAGFQSTVSFDPTQLHLTGAKVENELASSGRGIVQLGPVFRDSAVVIGAATCPVAQCDDSRPGRIAGAIPGVDGQITLATISFYSAAPGRYTLKLDDVRLVDTQGQRLMAGAANTVLDVSAR